MPKGNGTRGGIRGSLQGSHADYFNNLVDSVAMLEQPPVVLDDTAATTLTIGTHSGVTCIVPDQGQTNTYSIPTPTTAGQHYHFIYAGAVADASNVIFRTVTTDGSVYFKGCLGFIIADPDASATNAQITVYSDGDSNEMLTCTTPGMIDVHFLSTSTTVWYVWGIIASATAPAFAD